MTRCVFSFLALVGMFSFAALPGLAQTIGPSPNGQITGQVRLKGGQPASNVLVTCDRLAGALVGQVQTDRGGRFRFTGLVPARYNITIRLAGYGEERRTVDLRNDASQISASQEDVQFTLTPDGSQATTHASTTAPTVIDPRVPAPARKEYEDGLAAINQGQPDQAILHLEKAITLYKDYHEAYLLLGTAYIDTKQWDKAELALRRAMQINPKSTAAYFALGEAYLQQKKYAEAEKTIKDGLKIEERSWQGHYALGRLYWEQNDIVKAGREVAKTLQLKPDLAEAHLLGANILLRARKAEDALAEYKEYLRLEPNGKFAVQAKEMVAKIEKALAEEKK